MSIDIENPGGNEAALREALRDLVGGMRFISSVQVTTPVEYVDVALPAGYSSYRLEGTGVRREGNNSLAFAVSMDGGLTFKNDADNFDTYNISILGITAHNPAAVTTGDGLGSLGIAGDDTADEPANFVAEIFPGDASTSFLISGRNANGAPTTSDMRISIFSTQFAQDAIVPPTLARINMIRICPYGNGDADPPTSGHEITAMTITLFGVPI